MSCIEEITIEIGGETKGLDAALRKVNTTTRNQQNKIKRVDSLLKVNPRKKSSRIEYRKLYN